MTQSLDPQDIPTIDPNDSAHALRTRSAVVTGASSGIGRAIALELARAGAYLHLVGRDEARLADVVRQARELGTQADAHACDLADDTQVAALARELEREVKGIDILVHSAGVVSLGPLAEASLDDLDWQFRVNVRAPYALTQALLPLVTRARGVIAFLNSGAGQTARGGWSAYAISKHGLKALADSLRDELRPAGVRVISVYPGRTASPMQRRVREQEGQPYDENAYPQPEDVARPLVAALALPARAEVSDLSIRPGPG